MCILVSINCMTYNHEAYISDAIESFLMQKTDFDFEIIIGEDCSQDNTRKIVEKYASKYPGKIKLITSHKNVGAMKNMERIQGSSRGKYVAVCEGDDYWTDPYKLQKQVDYMEQHPDCTLSFHNAKVVKANKDPTGKMVIPYDPHNETYYHGRNSKYTAGELALLGFIPTASKMYLKYTMDNLPKWFMEAIVGDYPSTLIMASQGHAYYIDEDMCSYRTGVEGSSMDRWEKEQNTAEKKFNHNKGYIDILDNFNKYSNYKYFNEVDRAKAFWEFQILIIYENIRELKTPRYKEHFHEHGVKGKIKIYARCYFPKLYTKLSKKRVTINKLEGKQVQESSSLKKKL